MSFPSTLITTPNESSSLTDTASAIAVGAIELAGAVTAPAVVNIRLQAGHPVIVWTKGDAAGLEIWTDRGVGSFFWPLIWNRKPPTTAPCRHRATVRLAL